MECKQPNVTLPVDFEGRHLNVLIGVEGRVWVCIDGESVFRAKNLKLVTVQDNRLPGQVAQADEYQLLQQGYLP
jgi:hypothetical protein